MTDHKHENDCKHPPDAIQWSASWTTSTMALQLHIFGIHCTECGKQWDIGNLIEAVGATEKLTAEDAREAAYGLAARWRGNPLIEKLRAYTDRLEGK